MFCPQCGTDSAEGQHYCRSCGTNLKVVGKAVSLGDVISKTDGVPAKVKEIMSNIKIAHVTDEVSRAMEKMNAEIARSAAKERVKRRIRKEKTAEERRERHITRGTIKFFWGSGLSIFLYFLSHGIVEVLELQRGFTLVAQDLDDRRAAFVIHFNTRVVEADDVHLQGLHQKVAGVPAARTRKRHLEIVWNGWGGRNEELPLFFVLLLVELGRVPKTQNLS